jgi:hypothetical protein
MFGTVALEEDEVIGALTVVRLVVEGLFAPGSTQPVKAEIQARAANNSPRYLPAMDLFIISILLTRARF